MCNRTTAGGTNGGSFYIQIWQNFAMDVYHAATILVVFPVLYYGDGYYNIHWTKKKPNYLPSRLGLVDRIWMGENRDNYC